MRFQQHTKDLINKEEKRDGLLVREQLDENFQTLIFHMQRLSLAVPLIKLGGIHTYESAEVTPLFGCPNWFLGLLPSARGNLLLVDTFRLLMPEKHTASINQEYQYAIVLDDSPWALACMDVGDAKLLNRREIRWSQSHSRKQWFAGMLVQPMCALLEVDALIQLFNDSAAVIKKLQSRL